MAYVADLNLDDHGMTAPPVMQLGQDFAKSWRVKNSGTCAWEPDFELAYVNGNRAGAAMSGSPVAVGRAVEPGEEIDLTASLRAPRLYGTFQGFWQMRDRDGQFFGEVVWVGIQVPDPNPPPPPPPPPANVNPNLRADTNYVNPGQCTTIRWDVDNVNSVYFVDGGNVQGVGGHDSRTVCPWNTTTYILRVVRLDGTTVDFPITINVGGGGNAPYTINFWVDNANINRGQCTTLRWDVQGVREVYLNDEGVPGVSARRSVRIVRERTPSVWCARMAARIRARSPSTSMTPSRRNAMHPTSAVSRSIPTGSARANVQYSPGARRTPMA